MASGFGSIRSVVEDIKDMQPAERVAMGHQLLEDLAEIVKPTPPDAGGKKPFIVYELQDSGKLPFDSHTQLMLGEPPPVKYAMTQVGCFFAANESDACRAAALSENHLGYFVAVGAEHHRLEFAPAGDRNGGVPPDGGDEKPGDGGRDPKGAGEK